MPITATKLRQDIYAILDTVIATGVPVQIERKGVVLTIAAPMGRLERIKRMGKKTIIGDPQEIIDFGWDPTKDADWRKKWGIGKAGE